MRQAKVYVVKENDNLYSIANKYGTTVKQLMELNKLHNTHLHIGQILIISLDDKKDTNNTPNYQDFLNSNLGEGTLKVETRVGNTYFPISNAKIEVYKDFKDTKQVFFTGYTEENGIIDNIILPSPVKQKDYQNGASIYRINATHPNYQSTNIEEVYIYDGIKSIQKIEMLPKNYIEGKGTENGY